MGGGGKGGREEIPKSAVDGWVILLEYRFKL